VAREQLQAEPQAIGGLGADVERGLEELEAAARRLADVVVRRRGEPALAGEAVELEAAVLERIGGGGPRAEEQDQERQGGSHVGSPASTAAIVRGSPRVSIGLETYASQPAASAASRSPRIACAVTATI